jgi:hypothetical protein
MEEDRVKSNPFYVLGLAPTASRLEVERQGQKLLGLLEVGARQAASYRTPLGVFPRDADRVRQALAELRDPARRVLHELWAALPADTTCGAPAAPSEPAPAPWAGALEILGWRPGR